MGIVSSLGPERYERLKSAARNALPLTNKQIAEIKRPLMRYRQKYIERFVFIHINKCGGTSIERALSIPFLNHDTLEERLTWIGEERAQYRFKFSFVRHPLDRILSIFRYRHQTAAVLSPKEQRELFQTWAWSTVVETRATSKMLMPQVQWLLYDQRIGVDFVGRFERMNQDFEYVRRQLKLKATLPKLKITTSESRPSIGWWFNSELRRKLEEIYAPDFAAFDYD